MTDNIPISSLRNINLFVSLFRFNIKLLITSFELKSLIFIRNVSKSKGLI